MPWRFEAVGGLMESGNIIICGGHDKSDNFRCCVIVGDTNITEITCVNNRLYAAGVIFGQTFLLTGGITRYTGCQNIAFLHLFSENDHFSFLDLSIPLNWFTQTNQNPSREEICHTLFARIAWLKLIELQHFSLVEQMAQS